MENLYVFNFSVKNFGTKKTERVSIIAASFDETRDILFDKFGSNYPARCELTSFYPYTKKEVK